MALNLAPQATSRKTLGSIMELKKQTLQFSLTEISFLVILIGLFSWFLVLPKWEAYKKDVANYNQLVEEKGKIDSQIADLKSSIQVMLNNQKDFDKLNESLPLNTNPTTLQILFEEMTKSSDIVTRNLSVNDRGEKIYAADPQAIKNPYKLTRSVKVVPGSLDVSGDFSKLQSFLKKIEKTNRLIKVTSVEFEREQGDLLLMRLNFEAYSYE